MDLADLRHDAAALLADRARAAYALAAGRTTPAELGERRALLAAHPLATSTEAVPRLLDARVKAEGRRAARLGNLGESLLGIAAELAAADARDALDRAWLEATVPSSDPGARWSLPDALARLSSVPDPDARHRVERGIAEAFEDVDRHRARVFEAHVATTDRLGLGAPPEAHGRLLGLDLDGLDGEAEALLANTEAAYFDLLSWWLPRTTGARPFPHGARRHDLLRALAATPFESAFPKHDLLQRVGTPFARAGLHPLAHDRVRVDAVGRSTKGPGTSVHPLDPPGRVWLVWRAEGGVNGLRSLLRGLGAGLFFAHVEAARPPEDRLCGDRALAAGLGGLIESLAVDRAWLSRVFGVESDDLVRAIVLARLFDLRREAVRWLHYRALLREGVSASQAGRFVERFARALGGEWPREFALVDVPSDPTGADLRAAGLGAALFLHVRDTFDEDWWRNPRTAAFVTGFALQGGLEPAPVLAKKLLLPEPTLARAADVVLEALR